MIDLDISEDRAAELGAAGFRPVSLGPFRRGYGFTFTGPGLSLAKLAYGSGPVEKDWLDFTDQSKWDIAILRVVTEEP